MAVMDSIEAPSMGKEGLGGAAPAAHAPRAPPFTLSFTPAAPVLTTSNNKENTPTGCVASSTPAPSSATLATKRTGGPSLLRGPSPEKGSGQDRFRQLIQGAHNSTFTDNRYISSTRKSSQGSAPYHASGQPSVIPPPFTLRAEPAIKPVAMEKNIAPAAKPRATIEPAIPVNPATPTKDGRNANANANANANGKGNGNSNTKGPSSSRLPIGSEFHPTTATSILSKECQKRSFNPSFTEKITENGEYTYSVNLNGTILRGNRSYPAAGDAKQAVAKQAISCVRKMPCMSLNTKAQEKAKHEASKFVRSEGFPVKRIVLGANEPRAPTLGYPAAPGVPIAVPTAAGLTRGQPYIGYDQGFGQGYNTMGYGHRSTNGYDRGIDRGEEQAFLVDRVQALFGRRDGPSSSILKNPLASQAFLEGFALGGRLQESARHQPVSFSHPQVPNPMERPYAYAYNQRERSPEPFPVRDHRVRSPLRPRRAPYGA